MSRNLEIRQLRLGISRRSLDQLRDGHRLPALRSDKVALNFMILFIRRVWAFVERDWRLTISYHMQFFLRILSILIVVTTVFFISRIFSGFTDPRFTQWRDPLAAWLTGLAVLNYFMTGFSSLANAIRQEQVQGTLESVLMTPINVPTVIVASSAWDFVEATFSGLPRGWLVPGSTPAETALPCRR